MAVYFIQGHLGSGKSVQAVGRLRHYARAGRRIAGNIDLNLVELCGSKKSKVHYLRIPDIPTVDDLDAIGLGSDSRAEDTYGALVLDEGAVLFNARDWNQKGRKEVINWFVHARKKRWDVFILIQHVDALDNQIHRLLCEYTVNCYRLDRVNIPFFGRILQLFGLSRTMPKIFMASVRYGRGQSTVKADTWTTSGRSIWKCYDTEQSTTDKYDSGVYCQLSPWHTVGRYQPKAKTVLQHVAFVFFLLVYYLCKLIYKENPFHDFDSDKPLPARNSARRNTVRGQALFGHGGKDQNPVPL